MRLKEKNLLQKFAATLKKFSTQGAKQVEYGMYCFSGVVGSGGETFVKFLHLGHFLRNYMG